MGIELLGPLSNFAGVAGRKLQFSLLYLTGIEHLLSKRFWSYQRVFVRLFFFLLLASIGVSGLPSSSAPSFSYTRKKERKLNNYTTMQFFEA